MSGAGQTDAQVAGRDGTPRAELAFWLRDLKRQSGLSFPQIAERSGYQKTALNDACTGRRAATLPLLRAMVQVCGGDVEQWSAYWATIERLTDQGSATFVTDDLRPPWITPPTIATQPILAAEFLSPDPVESGPTPTTSVQPEAADVRPRISRRRRIVLVGSAAVLVLLTGTTLVVVNQHSSAPAAGPWTEIAFNHNGSPTLSDPSGVAGQGPTIAFKQAVQVSCKLMDPSIPSLQPDGYWYRIASPPWSNHYYAPANTFLNGDDPNTKAFTHNTDFSVADC